MENTCVFRSCKESLSSICSMRDGRSLLMGRGTISATCLESTIGSLSKARGDPTDIALYSWVVSYGALSEGRLLYRRSAICDQNNILSSFLSENRDMKKEFKLKHSTINIFNTLLIAQIYLRWSAIIISYITTFFHLNLFDFGRHLYYLKSWENVSDLSLFYQYWFDLLLLQKLANDVHVLNIKQHHQLQSIWFEEYWR